MFLFTQHCHYTYEAYANHTAVGHCTVDCKACRKRGSVNMSAAGACHGHDFAQRPWTDTWQLGFCSTHAVLLQVLHKTSAAADAADTSMMPPGQSGGVDAGGQEPQAL